MTLPCQIIRLLSCQLKTIIYRHTTFVCDITAFDKPSSRDIRHSEVLIDLSNRMHKTIIRLFLLLSLSTN